MLSELTLVSGSFKSAAVSMGTGAGGVAAAAVAGMGVGATTTTGTGAGEGVGAVVGAAAGAAVVAGGAESDEDVSAEAGRTGRGGDTFRGVLPVTPAADPTTILSTDSRILPILTIVGTSLNFILIFLMI